MKDWKIILPILVVMAFVIAGVFQVYKSQNILKKNTQPESSPSPSAEKFPTALESPNATTSSVLAQSQPATGSDTLQIQNIGIFVDLPQPYTKVESPLKIAGRANVLGEIQIDIKNESGKILGTTTANACLGYNSCYFESTIIFNNADSQTGFIEVYNPSTFDSSQQYIQIIPVSF